MVNYKLGALVGSGCDTIIADIRHEILDDTQIQVSPNPSSSKVKITITGNKEPLQMVVYNTLGEILNTGMLNKETQLDVSNYPNGLYQVVLSNYSGKQYHTHFVVAK